MTANATLFATLTRIEMLLVYNYYFVTVMRVNWVVENFMFLLKKNFLGIYFVRSNNLKSFLSPFPDFFSEELVKVHFDLDFSLTIQ